MGDKTHEVCVLNAKGQVQARDRIENTDEAIRRYFAKQPKGMAVALEAGTKVKVLSESFNEREVEVIDGPRKGIKGWVPFEWLKPL